MLGDVDARRAAGRAEAATAVARGVDVRDTAPIALAQAEPVGVLAHQVRQPAGGIRPHAPDRARVLLGVVQMRRLAVVTGDVRTAGGRVKQQNCHERDGANRAVIGYESKDEKPDTDFQLVYSSEVRDVGLS